MSWTEDKVAILQQLWGTGKSASEIAVILGGMTRNAVIGKAHRLGLSVPSTTHRRAVDRRKPEPEGTLGEATILSLTERMCRWPLGDPRESSFRFCGRQVTPGQSYCADHISVAYQQPVKKREDDKRAIGA
jgi:GcrA cell cycle regulator